MATRSPAEKICVFVFDFMTTKGTQSVDSFTEQIHGCPLKLLASDSDVTALDEMNYCPWATLGPPLQANYPLWEPQGPTKEVHYNQNVLVWCAVQAAQKHLSVDWHASEWPCIRFNIQDTK